MRVLWFTNIPLPAVYRQYGREVPVGSGWWMSELAKHLRKREGLELAIATADAGFPEAGFAVDGVQYFVISESRGTSSAVERQNVRKCADVANAWKPDVIHVHGTERYFGCIRSRKLVDVPTVVSIQGLVGPYARVWFGGLSFREVLATHLVKDMLLGIGVIGQRRQFRAGALREEEIIRGADAILGRTDWDRAHAWRVNPQARYYRVGEVLREGFYRSTWELNRCRRHRVMITNARNPMRGLETLLDAIAMLRGAFPDIRLAVAAALGERSGYGRFLRRRIARMGLTGHVELLGALNENDLITQLQMANAFVIASYLENSPNSLCEAMRVGLPCVASYVGGIPSLIDVGKTALSFPAGDSALLALNLRRIFEDDGLAVRLGAAAQQEAAVRHDPERVVDDLLASYRGVLSRGGEE